MFKSEHDVTLRIGSSGWTGVILTGAVLGKPANTLAEGQLTRRETLDLELLFLLEGDPAMPQREIAERLGVSLGNVNMRIHALLRRGILAVGRDLSSHVARRTYTITAAGRAERAAVVPLLLERKLSEFETLKAQIESLRRQIGPDCDG